ncbi:MAG: hypothetical protein SNJ33_00235 [Rikenellaceae bacterium]
MIDTSIIEHHKALRWLAICLLIVSCSIFTESATPFISTSGSGELIINNQSPISLERIALVINDIELQLHILGSSATIDYQGDVSGDGASIIATLTTQTNQATLEVANYTINDSCSLIYSSNIDSATSTREYITITTGSLIIRQSQSLYDVRAICQDSNGDNLIISFTGYIYRSVEL